MDSTPLPSSPTLKLQWLSEADTQKTAQQLATAPELATAIIALHGGLGAGKTTFTRHLLQALGVQGRIKSPTYAIVEPYGAEHFSIWHFDFYRFNDPYEWEDAGFRDIFATQGLKLIEWAQQAGELLPPLDLEFFINRTNNSEQREVQVQANSELGQKLITSLMLNI